MQQNPLAFGGRAVQKNAALGKFLGVFAVAFHALIQKVEIAIRGVLERHPKALQQINRFANILGAQRYVLNALALVFIEEFGDLRNIILDSFKGIRILPHGLVIALLTRPVSLPSMSKYRISRKLKTSS